MCLEEMATHNAENCVWIQCHLKVYTDEEKHFDAITGLKYVAKIGSHSRVKICDNITIKFYCF